jgi:hypothetical protein
VRKKRFSVEQMTAVLQKVPGGVPAAAAPVPLGQIRGDAALTQKHQARRVEGRGLSPPDRPRRGDVSAILLGCAYRSFLCDSPASGLTRGLRGRCLN